MSVPVLSNSRSQLSCLVVDDEQEFVNELVIVLEHMGVCVHCAVDGHSALASAWEKRPQLVLMDINMPSWDGLRAADSIRHLLPHALIVLMSGDPAALEDARRLSHLATHTLRKPIDMSDFTRLIETVRSSLC